MLIRARPDRNRDRRHALLVSAEKADGTVLAARTYFLAREEDLDTRPRATDFSGVWELRFEDYGRYYASWAQVRLTEAGAVVKVVDNDPSGGLNLVEVLEELGRAGITSLLVEGGGKVHAAFLKQNLYDQANLFIAPIFIGGDGVPVVDLLLNSDLATGKGDARRSIAGGGIYLNNERVTDPAQMATITGAIDGQFLVLRKGRKRYHLVQIVG